MILTRRPAETIYIGDEVTVTVLGVVGHQVRFGINAPKGVIIDREEIRERKLRERGQTLKPVHRDAKFVKLDERGDVNGNVAETPPPPVEPQKEEVPQEKQDDEETESAEVEEETPTFV